MKTLRYVVAYLLIIQLVVPALIPLDWLYHYRMDYEVVKNNPSQQIDTVLARLKREIDTRGLDDYIVMLGDSVGYSGPGAPEQSINACMEQMAVKDGQALPIFNLSMPAMQAGDLYVMLLKLEQFGIRTDRLIINLIYPGFIARTPLPSIVFWLSDDLKELDPEAYRAWETHLQAGNHAATPTSLPKLVREELGSYISLVRYRDFIKERLLKLTGLQRTQGVYDIRPWYEKEGLREAMQTWEYQNYFNPQPFDMTANNPQIYFFERLFAKAHASQLLVYLSPVNQELMDNYVAQPGYQANLKRIDQWMEQQHPTYLNLEHSIDQALFADHLHLTPEGYQQLAALLWSALKVIPEPTAN